MLKGKNITFSYSDSAKGKIQILKDISFHINKGDFIGLIGASGSGKTTFIKHLNGLLKADCGEIFFEGQNIYEKKYPLSQLRKEVGLVFQYPEQQLFGRTVLKDTMYGPLNLGMSEQDAKKSAIDSLELVGITEEYYQMSPIELSGGQKRCVASPLFTVTPCSHTRCATPSRYARSSSASLAPSASFDTTSLPANDSRYGMRSCRIRDRSG